MSQTSKQFRISIARAWVSALMRVNEILRALINPHARVTRARRSACGIRDYSTNPRLLIARLIARTDRARAPRSATPNKSPSLALSLSLSFSFSVTSAFSTPIRPSLRNHLVERPNKSDRRDWRALSIKNDETERRGRARSLARSFAARRVAS